MTNNYESIIEKLKKVKALADSGHEGEAIAAKNRLTHLLAKYSISIEELEDVSKLEERGFSYSSVWQRKLISQTIYSVLARKYDLYTYKGKKVIIVNITAYEYAEISSRIDFHKEQFKKEIERQKETLYAAYIQKHRLFPEKKDDDIPTPEMPPEEMAKILAAMASLEDVTFTKAIENN